MGQLTQNYLIQDEIGRGGFSVTFQARRRGKSKQKVLVKELLLDKIEDWKAVESFEREARILSHLRHEHIPDFIEFIEEQQGDTKRLFLVQEFIEGQDLASLIREGKFFTESEVIDMALTLARVLQQLHQTSPPLIHRDIKPSNIMLRNSDQKVYLIDFGAAKGPQSLSAASGLTVTGTFGYMPIEQTEGRAVPASDLYALGMSLIFILSHQEPHALPKDKQMRPDFRDYVNISERFSSLIDKLVETDVRRRYSSADVLIRDLEALKQSPGAVKFNPKLGKNISIAVLAFLVLGFCALNEHKTEKKIDSTIVARQPPESATELPVMTLSAYRSTADSFYKQKKYAKALPYYKKVIDQDRSDGRSHFRYAFCLGALDQYQAAVLAYKKVYTDFPDQDDYTQFNIGVNLYHLNKFQEALPYFEAMRPIRPKDASVFNYLGIIQFKMGQLDLAEKDLKKALALDPTYKYALNNLGQVYQEKKIYPQALSYYSQAAAQDANYALPHYRSAKIYYAQEKYQDCINAAQKAIEISRSYALAHNQRGLCFRHLKAYDSAVSEFRAALVDDPKSSTAQYNLALTLSDLGRAEDAKSAYIKVIQMEPSHTPTLNNLGQLYYAEKNYQEAEKYYQSALKYKKSALYLDNLGKTQSALGQCTLAQSSWQEACHMGRQVSCKRRCES